MRRAAYQAAWGIFAGLMAALLLAAGFVPTGRIGLYVLAALCAASVCRLGVMRDGMLCALAAALTAVILLPDKLAVLPFALFAAPHALVWCAVYTRPRRVRWVCKGGLAFIFGLMAGMGLKWLETAFLWVSPVSGWAVGLAVAAVLPVYDGIFTGAMRVLGRYLGKLVQ